jgi:hypothetical protein
VGSLANKSQGARLEVGLLVATGVSTWLPRTVRETNNLGALGVGESQEKCRRQDQLEYRRGISGMNIGGEHRGGASGRSVREERRGGSLRGRSRKVDFSSVSVSIKLLQQFCSRCKMGNNVRAGLSRSMQESTPSTSGGRAWAEELLRLQAETSEEASAMYQSPCLAERSENIVHSSQGEGVCSD